MVENMMRSVNKFLRGASLALLLSYFPDPVFSQNLKDYESLPVCTNVDQLKKIDGACILINKDYSGIIISQKDGSYNYTYIPKGELTNLLNEKKISPDSLNPKNIVGSTNVPEIGVGVSRSLTPKEIEDLGLPPIPTTETRRDWSR